MEFTNTAAHGRVLESQLPSLVGHRIKQIRSILVVISHGHYAIRRWLDDPEREREREIKSLIWTRTEPELAQANSAGWNRFEGFKAVRMISGRSKRQREAMEMEKKLKPNIYPKLIRYPQLRLSFMIGGWS